VSIRPKNFKLASGIETQIRKRVERLPRHLDNIHTAEVVLAQQPTHLTPQRFQYVAQLTLHTRNNLIRSEVSDPELLTAIDQAMDRVSRQIERYKGRLYKRHKGKPSLGKVSADMANQVQLEETTGVAEMAAPSEAGMEETYPRDLNAPENGAVEDTELGSIVRVKRFNIKPMFAEEAIEQMELLGHNFFVFWNAADERLSVLYRRNDGDYGLLEPELT
jgi:ribosome hibernation promoting factor